MAKRKGKGLGSSTATHQRQGGSTAQQAIVASGDTVRAIKRGNCDKAFDHLVGAVGAFSQHMAHVEATGENHNREAAHNVYEARTQFRRACLR